MKRRASRNYEIRKLATAGTRRAEIAQRYGISVTRVGVILRRDGLVGKIGRPRLPDMNPADYADYVKLRAICGAAYARREMGLS